MDILNFENMGALEIAMIVIATVIVCIVLYFQIASFNETAAKIKQLASFFPHADAYKKIDTSITKSILDSKAELHKFIINPPAKHIPTPVVKTVSEDWGAAQYLFIKSGAWNRDLAFYNKISK